MKYSHPKTGDEFPGKLSSYVSSKDLGLKGDGNDDPKKLQYAIDSLNDKHCVLYVEDGIYNLDKPLTAKGRTNISIIGNDPRKVKFIWQGAQGSNMLGLDGVSMSKFSRISFNGRGKARAGVDQSWSGIDKYFDTGNEYSDLFFEGFEHGIAGGWKGGGFAETSIMRCRFKNISKSGVSLGNFNALDIWLWNCLFDNCTTGVTNDKGAGNFKVYRCVFKNNKSCDVWIGNTGGFSLRENYSKGSNMFLGAGFTKNSCPTILQGNSVLDFKGTGVYFSNQGPLALADNIFRALSGKTGPVITMENGELTSIGNTFNVENPIRANQKKIIFRDKLVKNINVPELILPNVPENLNRKVFEVTSNPQDAVNKANEFAGQRPIVHFANGKYNNVDVTLPQNSDIQMVGDGYDTVLFGRAKIKGPTKVTFHDITVNGLNGALDCITADGINQQGGRVFLNQVNLSGSKINAIISNLTKTIVYFVNGNNADAKEKGISVSNSKAAILCGSQSNNQNGNEVSNNGNFLIRDVWYESNKEGTTFRVVSGKLSLDHGSNASPKNASKAAIISEGGKLTVFGQQWDDKVQIKAGNVLLLNAVGGSDKYLEGKATVLNSRVISREIIGLGSKTAQDIGKANESFINEMLADIRSSSCQAQELTDLPEGITDLRMYRVAVLQANVGMTLRGDGSIAPITPKPQEPPTPQEPPHPDEPTPEKPVVTIEPVIPLPPALPAWEKPIGEP